MLLEKLFSFVDLGSQIRAAPPIRMVQQHQLSMIFSDFLLGQHALTSDFATRVSEQHSACKEYIAYWALL